MILETDEEEKTLSDSDYSNLNYQISKKQ